MVMGKKELNSNFRGRSVFIKTLFWFRFLREAF